MGRKRKKKKTEWKVQLKFELIGLSLLIFSLVSLAKLGSVGEALVHLFRLIVGEWYVALSLGLFISAIYIIIKRAKPSYFTRRLCGVYLLLFSFLLLSHVRLFEILAGNEGFSDSSVIRNTWHLFWLQVNNEAPIFNLGGGMIGALGYATTHFLFDTVGTFLVAFLCIVIAIMLITGKSVTDMVLQMLAKIKKATSSLLASIQKDWHDWKKKWSTRMKKKDNNKEEKKQTKENEKPPSHEEPTIHVFTEQTYINPENNRKLVSVDGGEKFTANENELEMTEQGESNEAIPLQSLIAPEEENKDYELPSLDLLQLPNNRSQHQEKQTIHENLKKLEQTLASFGVKAKVTNVHLGPAVTKYEVHPNVGVKVSKIVNLADDLALALAAKDIRIEAPIPGKSAIGIEVPNKEISIVTLREVLASSISRSDSHPLTVALGRDISGEPVLASLNKMPHLLIAGATGSGKSVCINGIITSILMKAKPHEVKMMMIDPKMVELNVYNGVPHLLTPVVTDPKKASQALKRVVSEMERRYELFSYAGTRNIEGYNEIIRRQNNVGDDSNRYLPYIVVIVDELADLMMVASGDVEDSITRLAQMARAAGIHMIIATQRPSVDVITGVIKANIPSRIAFGVSSSTDSRTILDSGGAEKLLGRGDMLYLPVGSSKPTRLQGAFLSEEEVEAVVNFVVSQQKAQYQEEMTPQDEPENRGEVEDELYLDAVELVTELNTASVSMLQRRFRIGYARAARLIDEMEARGVVGPYEGSKPREVLVSKPNEEEATS